MNIIVKGSHMEVTDAIREYLEKKVRSLEKFLDVNARIDAEVGKTSNHHKHGDIFRAELNISNEGRTTFVKAEEADLYAAIDKVRDEAAHVLASRKDKRQSLFRRGAQRMKRMFKRGR
jgi:putative sigma-54 modulation protein